MKKGAGAGALKREREQSALPEAVESDNESFDEENELTKVKIGKIPYGWYDEFKHFGYDKNLQKVTKQKQDDKITEFLKKSENKDWWRTIRDELNQRDIRLSDKQLELIDRIRSGKMASKTVATASYEVSYDYNDPFPVHAHPPAKRNFMPSKWEQMKINKILDGLLTGRIKWNQDEEEETEEDKLYDAWASGSTLDRGVINIAPMKQKLPGHNESYNPPKEYLLSEEELKEWQEMDEEDKPYNFIPTAFDKIRHIPLYDKLIQERFQRCLDLYLCPRIKKKKLNIDPDTLIPKLPDASTLRPFPTSLNISYIGHSSSVLSIATSPDGTYVASGDESGLIIIWETQTSKPLWRKQYSESILSIDWSCLNLIAFSHGDTV
jgi:ribosome biogenesis protein ERB1